MKVGKILKKTLREVPLQNKTVLVRVDYNVPLEKNGEIADDLRIKASMPTLRYLLKQHCKVVLIAHLGRPDGRDKALSLAPIAEHLEKILGSPVKFIDDCKGDKVKIGVKRASQGAVILLENLRFYPEEEGNDEDFAHTLVRDTGARYFVQDGFGVVHRAHASTDAVTHFVPSVAGLLLEREVTTIRGVMESPEQPLVAVLGGAKVSDKISIVEALEPIAEKILIGGAMANTFLKALEYDVGKSRCESDQSEEVKAIYEVAKNKVGEANVDEFIVLPTDVAVAAGPQIKTRSVVAINEIPDEAMALDIGDETIETFVKAIEKAKTVIWNGTLGYAENDAFAHGSARVAMALATHPNIISVIGGGDTADFVRDWDAQKGESFTHVSTGGGASLELMAGQALPGVESLLDA